MDNVELARSLFGTSMAFHIIFATLGVGIPFMVVFAELMFQIRKNKHYAILAKRWTKGFAIILGVAIPSGTIVGVMLSLLFPGFMAIVGQVIAVPFQVEIWAFLLEAVFMSIYVYAADRLSPLLRIVSVFFVALGASASAVLITDAHAWMNTPRGFDLVNGEVVNVDPIAAIFSPSLYTTALHVLSSAYMTGAFVIVSLAAYKLLKQGKSKEEYDYHNRALLLGLIVGGALSLFTALNGHATAQMLHHYQPEKLAAAEGLFETTDYAPLAIFGVADPETGEVKGGIEIPWALSFLAGNSFDTVVKGLNEYPRELWPPLYIHTLFNIMVVIGILLIGLSFGVLIWRYVLKRTLPRWLLRLLVSSGALSLIGIETGWIFSCTGRQPWTIYHMQLTKDAATQTGNLGLLFTLFVSIYAVLLFLTAFVLRYYFKRHPVSKDLMPQPHITEDEGVGTNG
ncbi:cytochrome ubiquinol oxidase subunit I [Paenibacillus abyssi]|uniref:Cytochrome bd menaquinol oxidase subunit I n=1 Tax=Paenibacillus abyssi TaxID=1340531 RepID=A0A917CJG2_9BACL|nr:cytochrome ubiquinol oxidase subunit I [Paenibacillus abyssi]GGF89400.1 putative cytochrome bd menaquinol oxidase subunit I [Paenibacillus abyssi]